MKRLNRFVRYAVVAQTLLLSTFSYGNEGWQQTVAQARGQTVYMNAWGGSEAINNYLVWTARELEQRFGITLHHTKIDHSATTVTRLLAEKNVDREQHGSIDLMWINGENFHTLNSNGLLYGPFVEGLPNWQYIDPKEKPTTVVDFGQPVQGMEAPWGMAQLVFIYDQDSVEQPPRSMTELLSFAKKHGGVFTYPTPPDFVGTTFLKQALTELINDKSRLSQPVAEDFEQVTQPLWQFLDALHPHLWRKGRTFPISSTAMLPLLDDGEIGFALSFNPNTAINAINDGLLPDTVRTYTPTAGSIGNSHFLAIPWNSSATAAAQVTINFLMSPEAQLRKADPAIWGDPTVLSMAKLPAKERAAFQALTHNEVTLGPALPEPHPSWMAALEQAWMKRYRE